MAKAFWVQAYPINPATGLTVECLFTTFNKDKGTMIQSGKTYLPYLEDYPSITVEVFAGQFDGKTTVTVGDMIFTSNVASVVAMMGYVWDGAAVNIFKYNGDLESIAVGGGITQATQIFGGVVKEEPQVNDAKMSISIVDKGYLLEQNLLTLYYAGTGGLEGPAGYAGVLKPLAIGYPISCAPILLESAFLTYQYNGYGKSGGVQALSENGILFGAATSTVAWAGSAAATYTALKAVSLGLGQWADAPSIGVFRLGGEPVDGGVLVVDVAGVMNEALGTVISTAKDVMIYLAAQTAVGSGYSSSNFTAWQTAIGSGTEIVDYITEQTLISDRIAQYCSGAGGYYYFDSTGVLCLGLVRVAGSPDLTIRSDQTTSPLVEDTKAVAISAPYKLVRLGAARTFRVHTLDEISDALKVAVAAAGLTATWNNIIGNGKPSDNAGSNFSLTASDNAGGTRAPTIRGNTITWTASDGGWHEILYTGQSFYNGAVISHRVTNISGQMMVGLTTGANKATLDYNYLDGAAYQSGSGLYFWSPTTGTVGSLATIAIGDVITLFYDGSYFYLYQNDAYLGRWAAPALKVYFGKIVNRNVGMGVADLQFNAYTDNTWDSISGANKASDGATADHYLTPVSAFPATSRVVGNTIVNGEVSNAYTPTVYMKPVSGPVFVECIAPMGWSLLSFDTEANEYAYSDQLVTAHIFSGATVGAGALAVYKNGGAMVFTYVQTGGWVAGDRLMFGWDGQALWLRLGTAVYRCIDSAMTVGTVFPKVTAYTPGTTLKGIRSGQYTDNRTYDSNGIVLPDTGFKNNQIILQPDGTATNTGGGQVTGPGLGLVPVTLTPLGSYTTITGNSTGKFGGTHGAYQGGAVGTKQSGPCYAQCSIISAVAGGSWVTYVGLDNDPTRYDIGSIATLYYATALATPAGYCTWDLRYNGGAVASGTGVAINANSRLRIERDGVYVRVLIDGVELAKTPDAGIDGLYPKFYDYFNNGSGGNPRIGIQYGPMSVSATPGATNDLELYGSGASPPRITGNIVDVSATTTNDWDALGLSRQGFKGPCTVTGKLTTDASMIGLTSVTTGTYPTYLQMHYGAYRQDGTHYYIFSNGTNMKILGSAFNGVTFGNDTIWTTSHDGLGTWRVFADGVEMYNNYDTTYVSSVLRACVPLACYAGNKSTVTRFGPFADVTAASQVTIAWPVSQKDIPADYLGTVATGALPAAIAAPKVSRGGVDITTADITAHTLQNVTGGCVGYISVDNTNGSATKGKVTVAAGWTATGGYEHLVAINGVAQPVQKVTVKLAKADAPAGGGGGGGGGSGTTGSAGSGSFTAGTTPVEILRISGIVVASGKTARCSFGDDYDISTYNNTNATRTATGHWEYSPAGANSWTAIGSNVNATSNAQWFWVSSTQNPGSHYVAQNQTGLSGTYDFRFVAALTLAIASGSAVYDGGGGGSVDATT